MTAATFERDRAAALRGWEPALAIVGLAMLAASYELEATDPEAENYD